MTEGSLPSAGQAGGVGLRELLRDACFWEDVLKEGTFLSFRIGEPELTFRGQRVIHAVPCHQLQMSRFLFERLSELCGPTPALGGLDLVLVG